LRIASDQIAFRVRRLSSRDRSTPSRFDPSNLVTTPPSSTTPAPTTLEPSTTPTSIAPALASVAPIPPPRFSERDESKVCPLAADPRLLDLQRATTARVLRFRHVPVDSWLPAQWDLAIAPLFSTRTHESYRAHLSA
jgi:hypothetical protein